MSRSRNNLGVLSVVGMLAFLAVVGGLDTFIRRFSRPSAATFNPWAAIWLQALDSLLIAALLLLLFWFVLERMPRRGWVAVVYLLVGSFLAFSVVLYYVPVVGSWWPVWFTTIVTGANSHAILAGGFIAMMGLYMLVLPRR